MSTITKIQGYQHDVKQLRVALLIVSDTFTPTKREFIPGGHNG